jgi:hypothetical protein
MAGDRPRDPLPDTGASGIAQDESLIRHRGTEPPAARLLGEPVRSAVVCGGAVAEPVALAEVVTMRLVPAPCR